MDELQNIRISVVCLSVTRNILFLEARRFESRREAPKPTSTSHLWAKPQNGSHSFQSPEKQKALAEIEATSAWLCQQWKGRQKKQKCSRTLRLGRGWKSSLQASLLMGKTRWKQYSIIQLILSKRKGKYIFSFVGWNHYRSSKIVLRKTYILATLKKV